MPDFGTKLIYSAYEKFNEREVDGTMELMLFNVEWSNGMEGGIVVSTDAARDYWTRQWAAFSSKVTPPSITKDGQDHVVEVRQVVKSLSGELISDATVFHRIRLRHGKIA